MSELEGSIGLEADPKNSLFLLDPSERVLNMNEIKELDSLSIRRDHERLAEAARCLREYLSVHGGAARPYQVLRFLADGTLRRIHEGKEPQFINVAIQEAVQGRTDDSSKWLSPIWNEITRTILPQRQDGLIKFARDSDRTCYPWVTKTESSGGAGNQALYRLEARDIPEPDFISAPAPQSSGSALGITYIPELRPEPAWWAKWFFEREFALAGWRKGVFFAVPFGWLLIILVLGVLSWLGLSADRTPLAPSHLMIMLGIGAIAYYGFHVLAGFERFVDDRIALVPVYLVALRESGVCVELYRPPDGSNDSPRSVRLVRYASQCPICRSQVLIERGEPDFPRRLVGRCQESPREHVFSYDRATHRGVILRGEGLHE